MKCSFSFLLIACGVLIASSALANREALFHNRVAGFGRLPVSDHARHGRRAYKVAKGFCQKHDIPHFEVQLPNGQKRLVMNIHGKQNLRLYKKVFSKQFMENFFRASPKDKPTWSYLRVGDKAFKKYQKGALYTVNISSTRVAFPYSVTKEELATRLDALQNTPDPPMDYSKGNPGGIYAGKFLRNCTDWATVVVGGLTGVKTSSVKHHASSLWEGNASERMTVQAFITYKKIDNFGAETLQRSWR